MSVNTTSNKVTPYYTIYDETFNPVWYKMLKIDNTLFTEISVVTLLDKLLAIDEQVLEAICLHARKVK